MWFDKPMSSLLEQGKPFPLLSRYGDEDIHHEIEVGVVIGTQGKDIRKEDAMNHVCAYFVGNDLTNRKL